MRWLCLRLRGKTPALSLSHSLVWALRDPRDGVGAERSQTVMISAILSTLPRSERDVNSDVNLCSTGEPRRRLSKSNVMIHKYEIRSGLGMQGAVVVSSAIESGCSCRTRVHGLSCGAMILTQALHRNELQVALQWV